MGAANIKAGGAYVELFVKDGTVQKTLASVRKQLTTFGQGIRNVGLGGVGLGTAIGAPLLAAVKSFSEAGAAVDDMAQRTGVGAAAIQELSFAAGQSATDVEALEKGLVKMQRTVVEAGDGSKSAQEALYDLGVSAAGLASLSPDQQFEAMADGIAKITDPAKRTAAAMAVFGKGGADLIPLLSMGSAGIEQFRAEARALGLVMDGESVQSAAVLDDSLHRLGSTFGAVSNSIGAALAGPIITFVDFLTTGAAAVGRFVTQNRGLVVGVGMAAVALVAGGAALVGIGTVIQVAGFAVGGLATAWAALGVVMATVAGSPLLLVLGGITLITAAVPQLREAAGEAFGFLFGGFTKLGSIVDDTMGGVADALAGGDLMLAADILWKGLYAAWLQGTENIRQVWREAVNGLASFGLDAFATFRSGWAETVRFFGDMWDMALGGMGGQWSEWQNSIASGMVAVMAKLTGQDPEEMQQSLREEQDAIKAASTARMAARAKDTSDKLAGIEEERTASQKALDDGLAAQNAAATQGIADAKAALAAARANAASVKEEAEAKRKKDTKLGLPKGIGTSADAVATFSTFSATAAQRSGIGGLGGLEKSSEKTAENTAEIARNTRVGAAFT